MELHSGKGLINSAIIFECYYILIIVVTLLSVCLFFPIFLGSHFIDAADIEIESFG